MGENNYPRISGIYVITCGSNGKIYIGSAINIAKRWIKHKSDLRLNKHPSTYLQNAWNKYGESSFHFTVIEEVEDEKYLIVREQYWLDFYQSYNHAVGFNMCSVAGSSLGIKRSNEAKAKMSAWKKTEEHGLKISIAKKGVPQPPEAVAKHADALSKNWIVTTPEGVQYEVRNLRKFCRENTLNHRGMLNVAQGKSNAYKGWHCEYA